MRRAIVLLTSVAVAAAGLLAAPATGATSDFVHLDPGGQPKLAETVPVNVVFVGYEPEAVPSDAYGQDLPTSYEPVVRSRLAYGIEEKLGITYDYDYRVTYASGRYEDRFFAELSRLATPAPLTVQQETYNAQESNVLDITENHWIDAPSVERWLADNPPDNVNTRRNTIFFVNWFGRSDFKFHVYTKTDEPDPDTGYNFGVERDSRKIIAWGGTTADDEENGLGRERRIWFHDLSAGPEEWTANYLVDFTDLDDNGVEDYRMPPIWEYTAGGYRAPGALAGDLGLITRYVAINLLFTSSPLYPVELPTEWPPRTINLDSNTYEGWEGVDASEAYITPDLLQDELAELRWRNELSYDNQDLPFEGKAEECYVGLLTDVSCYPESGYPSFANLYLQNTEELDRTKDDGASVDYELPMFNYAVSDPDLEPPLLGFADDNYVDGTQSYVFSFVSPGIVEAGYGLTTTMIHEVGHHVGMSHPHDGYDSASGVDYGPSDEYFFAWAGDEQNSIMSYIDLNWDFSQFDRDNSDRFLTAAYIEAANRLAVDVLADDNPRRATDELRQADRRIGQAKEALAAHNYRAALARANQAYNRVVAGGRQVGVSVDAARLAFSAEAEAARASQRVHKADEFIDTLQEGPRNEP